MKSSEYKVTVRFDAITSLRSINPVITHPKALIDIDLSWMPMWVVDLLVITLGGLGMLFSLFVFFLSLSILGG